MKRKFNITGSCTPQKHYMVPLDDRLEKIKTDYIDEGSYFVISKGRQYGKTTTLSALEKYLKDNYIVLSLDFQEIGTEDFADASTFAKVFAGMIIETLEIADPANKKEALIPLTAMAENPGAGSLKELFTCLSKMCAKAQRPIVLMIDEADSASNNQVFIDFLAQLRSYYLARDKKPIFHSVILAGVYDIKNLKLKLRPDAEHKYNSPWNIAARFNIDMNFSVAQIAAMLEEYENDKHTNMDVKGIAECIYAYTSGYPYLVSAVCKLLDEDIAEKTYLKNLTEAWSEKGIAEAVKSILAEQEPFFESMVRQLEEYPEMKKMLKAILFSGKRMSYNPDIPAINLASMFGYIVNAEGSIQVANRIFEMRLYNLFLSEEELSSAMSRAAKQDRNQFVAGGRLFLLYLKPIINGVGNYYIDAQTRDARRTDVIVDYGGEQFVIEMKLWHGNEYHQRGKRQLAECLDYYHQEKGYLLSFNFNKKKKTGVQEIPIDGKTIIEAVV